MVYKFQKLLVGNTNNWMIQFIRYFFVGGIAALTNFLFLFVFTDIFKIYYIVSNIFSFLIGLVVNYALSKKFVFFTQMQNKEIEFLIYGVIGVIGLFFDSGLMYFFTSIIGFYYLFSKILSTALVFIWNFAARKYFYSYKKGWK